MFTLPDNIPLLTTRQALVVLDLYFDRPEQKADYVNNIKTLIPVFRSSGHIIWASNWSNPPAHREEQSGGIQVESPQEKVSERKKGQKGGKDGLISHDSRPPPSRGRSHRLPRRAEDLLKRSLEKYKTDLSVFSASESSDGEDLLSPESTPEISPDRSHSENHPLATVPLSSFQDKSKDRIVDKKTGSAFKNPRLLMQLRSNLVTELFICGDSSCTSVYETALDAAQHGFSITILTDCLGYTDKKEHIQAVKKMQEFLAADLMTSKELVEEILGEQMEDLVKVSSKDGKKREADGELEPGLQGMIPHRGSVQGPPEGNDPSDGRSSRQRITPPREEDRPGKSRTSTETKIRVRRPAQPPPRRRTDDTPSSTRGTDIFKTKHLTPQNSTNLTQTKIETPSQDHSKPSKSPIPSQPSFGTGDSFLIQHLLPGTISKTVFQSLREEVKWLTMHHRGGPVPRLVASQGNINPEDGSCPIYRHPADEVPPLLIFSPTVNKIREAAQHALKERGISSGSLNHVLIQLYRTGEDAISEHADKWLDIKRGTSVVNVSIGAERIMILRKKKSAAQHDQGIPTSSSASSLWGILARDEEKLLRETQRIPLPHNSMFVLGESTNRSWLHSIRPDKRPAELKTNEELAFSGERISLTFRCIDTFITANGSKIWGQGAKAKRKEDAHEIADTHRNVELEAMLAAFGKENHQHDLSWEDIYGKGFDVVNFEAMAEAAIGET